MITSKKQTEKILGVTYTVGTKAHTIALYQVKLFNQLADGEGRKSN